jgi:hypothetical protein
MSLSALELSHFEKGWPRVAFGKALSVEILLVNGIFAESQVMASQHNASVPKVEMALGKDFLTDKKVKV